MAEVSFQELVQSLSDRCVCYQNNTSITLGDILARVNGLYQQLTSHQARNWILCSDSSLNFLCGFIALVLSNKEILLPPNNLPGTINDTISDADALLTDLEFDSCYPKLSLDCSGSSETWPADFPDTKTSYLQICTSGSTGEPKQIRKSLHTLEAEIQGLEQKWGDALKNRTIISTVSHQHIYGLLFRVLWPLLSGRVFVDENIEYPEQIESFAQQHGQLVLISSPAYLKRMADVLTPQAMRSVDVIYSSGGPLDKQTSVTYTEKFSVTPIEVLGSTETGGIAWRQQQAGPDISWQRFTDVQLQRSTTSGALLVKSPYCFTHDWFEMGDAVELVDERHFKLLGRIDRIVKIEEKRVSLDRMERSLVETGLVEQARLLPLQGYRTILGAVCILSGSGQEFLAKQGRRAISEALRDHLATIFDRVTLPRKWRYVADFPYNAQGKITQADLAALFGGDEETS